MSELLKTVKAWTGKTPYRIAKELNQMGIPVSNPSALKYSATEGQKGIRFDILVGIYKICAENGVSAQKFMDWLLKEFLPKNKGK